MTLDRKKIMTLELDGEDEYLSFVFLNYLNENEASLEIYKKIP